MLKWTGGAGNLILGDHVFARLLRDRVIVPLMNTASMQRRVWETVSQLKVTCRDGPLGRRARRLFSGQGPLPGDRVPDIECVRAEGGVRTTLHAELGRRWALIMPRRMVSDECAAIAAERLGDDGVTALVADDGEIMLVRPDAHLGWRGTADPDALDRWLAAVTFGGLVTPRHRHASSH